jgi:ParB-like chromosome segregation protein Spo0J
MKNPFPDDPISKIEWLEAARLTANDYNPNVVFSPELKLLERSIVLQGWTQPVLIGREGDTLTIIDGFHRTRLALDSKRIKDKYRGLVPCAVLAVTRPEAMLLTIRMNRAKGTHLAPRMAAIVKELLEVHQIDAKRIADEIGATAKEIELLSADTIWKQRNLKDYAYSKAWYPIETRNEAAKAAKGA